MTHSETYLDGEGQERCVDCDKWLEPGCYTIEDHARAFAEVSELTERHGF